MGLIRGGGSTGEEPGDGWRRDSGGTAAADRNSNTMRAELGHWVHVGAQVGARGELGVDGWSRALAEKEAHQRR
jgi:hypothetical protein